MVLTEPIRVANLAIKWDSQKNVLSVESGGDLPLEPNDEGWEVEATIFQEYYTYVGISYVGENQNLTPCCLQENESPLMKIRDPNSNQVWWIESGEWKPKNQCYVVEQYRTLGRAEVKLGLESKKLLITMNASSFTLEEMEYYLQDFKGALWELLLKKNGIMKGRIQKKKSSIHSEEFVEAVDQFVKALQRVAKNPNFELKETVSLLDRRKVKPLPITFRELTIKPNARQLMSRDHYNSYDTTENRYVKYCIEHILFLLKGVKEQNLLMTKQLIKQAENYKKYAESLRNTKKQKINENLFHEETKRIESLRDHCDSFVKRQQRTKPFNKDYMVSVFISLGKLYGNEIDCYFCNSISNHEKIKREKDVEYLVVQFPIIIEDDDALGLKEFLSNKIFLKSNMELRITSHCKSEKKKNSKGGKYQLLTFENIFKIESTELEKKLSDRKDEEKKYKASNWEIDLIGNEKENRDRTIKLAQEKSEYFSQHLELCKQIPQRLEPHIDALEKLNRHFLKIGVSKTVTSSESMVFVRNTDYANTKDSFKKINGISGIDSSLYNNLLSIEQISLIHVSLLYERWCLLQIINILHGVFRFNFTDQNWKETLTNAVLQKQYNIKLTLESEEREQRINLFYEKELPSRKRPDFMIEILSARKKEDKMPKKLVLDAKFKEGKDAHDIDEIVKELCDKKKYNEEGANQVFVIHPALNDRENARHSPLQWGKHCDYGEASGHKSGSIFLSPSLKYIDSIENLQRLLGMFLDSNSFAEPHLSQRSTPPKWHNWTCISCGNYGNKIKLSKTEDVGDRWKAICVCCGHQAEKTHCFNCKKNLFKHGWHWTYHWTRSNEISNVVCPECHSFF